MSEKTSLNYRKLDVQEANFYLNKLEDTGLQVQVAVVNVDDLHYLTQGLLIQTPSSFIAVRLYESDMKVMLSIHEEEAINFLRFQTN